MLAVCSLNEEEAQLLCVVKNSNVEPSELVPNGTSVERTFVFSLVSAAPDDVNEEVCPSIPVDTSVLSKVVVSTRFVNSKVLDFELDSETS